MLTLQMHLHHHGSRITMYRSSNEKKEHAPVIHD